MGILDSIGQAITGRKPEVQQPTQPQQQQNGAPNNGQNPPVPQNSPAPGAPVIDPVTGQQKLQSSDEMFSGIWNTPQAVQEEPIFKVDESTMDARLRGMDFVSGVDEATMQKALSGDANALKQVINAAGQTGFKRSMLASNAMLEQGFAKKMTALERRIEDRIKSNEVRRGLAVDNPAYQDPEVAPLISMLEHNLRQKFPEASAAQITEHAKKMLGTVGEKLNPTKDTKKVLRPIDPNDSANRFRNEQGLMDWEKYANEPDINPNSFVPPAEFE